MSVSRQVDRGILLSQIFFHTIDSHTLQNKEECYLPNAVVDCRTMKDVIYLIKIFLFLNFFNTS